MVGGLVCNPCVPHFLQNVIVAAPRVPYNIGSAMECNRRHKQVLDHQLVNCTAGNRVKAHFRPLVVWKVAIRVICFGVAGTLQDGLFFSYIVCVTICIGHGRDDQLSRLQNVSQVLVFAEV